MKNTAWPIVKSVFGWIADKATWLWDKGIKPAFDLIKSGVAAVVTAFENAKASVGKAWDGLLSGIRGPVLTALAWIDGHLIKPINSLLEKVGIAKIPSIMQNIPGNSGGRSLKGGTQKFATGGPVFGAGTATSDSIPAMLSNNEHVWTAREVAKAGGHRVMEWMRRAALAGDLRRILPTYAIGGRVSGLDAEFLRRLGLWNAAMGGRYSVSSGYRSIAEQTILWNRSDKSGRWVARPGSSRHNYGLAADLAPATLAAHRSAAGQHGLIFPMSWEPWHIEPVGIRSGQGVVGGILDAVAEKALAEINALIGRIPGRGVMGDAVRGGMRMFGRGLKDKVMALAFSDPANVSVPSGLSGSNRQIGQQMAARYGWTGAQWAALEKLWTGESNWNHLARNPSSGAYGIPQCVDLDTMILTRRGWLSHDEVRVGDETIGYDPHTGLSRWTRITDVHHYGPTQLYVFGTSRWRARSTGNHRWLTDTMVNDMPVERKFVQLDEFQGRRTRVVTAVPFESDRKLDITPEEAAVLGWLAGDGWRVKARRYRNARGRAKSVPETWHGVTCRDKRWEYFVALLESGAFDGKITPARDRGRTREYRVSAPYYRDLMRRAGIKDIRRDAPGMVLAMSDEQRAAWTEALLNSDGHFGDGYTQLSQNPGPVADAALIALYMGGHRVSETRSRRVRSRASTFTLARPYVGMRLGVVEPDGVESVWCVTTELGSWTARQDGQVMLTGNSLPASKMASVAGDWRTNPATQIKWGLDYIADRYGSPLAAYNAWLSRNPHWYSGGGRVESVRPFVADAGVRLAPGINVLDNRLGKPEPLARVDKEMLVRLHPDDLALLRLAVEQGTEVGAARGVGSGAAYVARVG